MSFLVRASTDKSPAWYLFEGLFPNLARYLAGGTSNVSKNTKSTKRLAQVDLPKDNTDEEVLPLKSSSIEGGVDKCSQAPSTPRQPLEAQSPSAEGKLDTTTILSRPELMASFGMCNIINSQRKVTEEKQILL